MKKQLVILLCSVFCSLNLFAQKNSFKNLIGRWESVEGPGLEIVDSSKLFLFYHGEKKQILSYRLNMERTPYWFDFTINENNEDIELKSLVLFVNEDLLQWQIFEDDRPVNFSADKGNMVYLKRKK